MMHNLEICLNIYGELCTKIEKKLLVFFPGCTDNAPWCMDYVSKNPGICYDQRHTELCCNACYLQRTSNPGMLLDSTFYKIIQLLKCCTFPN